MGAILDALRELQQVELKLVALKQKIDAKKRSVRVHQRKLAQFDQQIAEIETNIQKHQAAINQVELEIKSSDQEITKLRTALNTAKTNKEYAAILTQINTDKADTSKLEDRVLEMMGEIEAMREQVAALQAAREKEQLILENAQKTVDAYAQGSQNEMEALTDQRTDASKSIPTDALAVFERVSERHDGEALGVVEQPNPRVQEFVCGGCNMGLRLEQFAALQSRDEVQCCHSCGRILILDVSLVR